MEFIFEIIAEVILYTILRPVGALLRWPFLYRKRTLESILQDNYMNSFICVSFFGTAIFLTVLLS